MLLAQAESKGQCTTNTYDQLLLNLTGQLLEAPPHSYLCAHLNPGSIHPVYNQIHNYFHTQN